MKQILCFGDSNTYGLVPGSNERYPWEIRWTGILDQHIRRYGYRVVEEGLCGRTTVFADELREGRRGVDLLPTLLESHQPLDAVILMLGTNDCKTVFGASPEVIGKGMEKLVLQVKKADPHISILIASPIHLGEAVWKEEYDPEFSERSVETSRKLKEVYRRIAEKHGCAFLAASDFAEPSKEDREHLNEEGHALFADAVINKIYNRLSII